MFWYWLRKNHPIAYEVVSTGITVVALTAFLIALVKKV